MQAIRSCGTEVDGGKICNPQSAVRPARAFTLIELLVVIVILGILAALVVPALKNLGKSNAQVGAARQLLDDIGRARALAIGQRTTVYMVFVPTNFWSSMDFTKLTPVQKAAVTNLAEKQLTGYNFISYGKVGDQPGQHTWHYLSDWQTLPQGTFIPVWKFASSVQPFTFNIPASGKSFSIYQFDYANNNIPFPTDDTNIVAIANLGAAPRLPYIAFNYLGQLVSSHNDLDSAGNGADIPLAQGTVSFGVDINKQPTLTTLGGGDITETPAGNSTNIAYNIIHIDPLTGRAVLQKFQMP